MLNSVSLEKQAFYLSRIIYRDTVIEDYHHKGAVLSTEIYNAMIEVVDGNVKKSTAVPSPYAGYSDERGHRCPAAPHVRRRKGRICKLLLRVQFFIDVQL